MRRVIVLLNPRAGGRPEPRQVREALAAVGVEADVRPLVRGGITAAASVAVRERPDAVVAAGGDGTVSGVAAALAETDVPLGVLPVGTLNHFARDLGIPPDLAGAAAVIAAGNVRAIDLGEVNGLTFVNNSSIGLYPLIVRRREGIRRRLGRGKWAAMAVAVVSVFRRFPLVHVTLQLGGEKLRCKTPLVFVGNNRYVINFWSLGRRERLDAGELSVYLINAASRLRFVWLALRALLGRLRQESDFQQISVPHLRIDSRRRRLRVARDGEITRLHPPLEYRIRPRSLRVLSPG